MATPVSLNRTNELAPKSRQELLGLVRLCEQQRRQIKSKQKHVTVAKENEASIHQIVSQYLQAGVAHALKEVEAHHPGTQILSDYENNVKELIDFTEAAAAFSGHALQPKLGNKTLEDVEGKLRELTKKQIKDCARRDELLATQASLDSSKVIGPAINSDDSESEYGDEYPFKRRHKYPTGIFNSETIKDMEDPSRVTKRLRVEQEKAERATADHRKLNTLEYSGVEKIKPPKRVQTRRRLTGYDKILAEAAERRKKEKEDADAAKLASTAVNTQPDDINASHGSTSSAKAMTGPAANKDVDNRPLDDSGSLHAAVHSTPAVHDKSDDPSTKAGGGHPVEQPSTEVLAHLKSKTESSANGLKVFKAAGTVKQWRDSVKVAKAGSRDHDTPPPPAGVRSKQHHKVVLLSVANASVFSRSKKGRWYWYSCSRLSGDETDVSEHQY